jgi:hypothetical protein
MSQFPTKFVRDTVPLYATIRTENPAGARYGLTAILDTRWPVDAADAVAIAIA